MSKSLYVGNAWMKLKINSFNVSVFKKAIKTAYKKQIKA
jgi:hypothetical protein